MEEGAQPRRDGLHRPEYPRQQEGRQHHEGQHLDGLDCLPLTYASPPLALSSPQSTLMVVVLPAPFGPSSP